MFLWEIIQFLILGGLGLWIVAGIMDISSRSIRKRGFKRLWIRRSLFCLVTVVCLMAYILWLTFAIWGIWFR